jgi:hypothetical protein
MRRWILYLAWAWEIIIGALLITPRGVVCIACGYDFQTPGYIGRPATMFFGVVAIVLGLYGFISSGVPRVAASVRE